MARRSYRSHLLKFNVSNSPFARPSFTAKDLTPVGTRLLWYHIPARNHIEKRPRRIYKSCEGTTDVSDGGVGQRLGFQSRATFGNRVPSQGYLARDFKTWAQAHQWGFGEAE
jgi:hypothetical protein